MKVSNRNFLPNNRLYTNRLGTYNRLSIPVFKGSKPLQADKVELSESIYGTALSKINDVTKDEYDSLTEAEKNVLRAKLNNSKALGLPESKDIKEQANRHLIAAAEIKKAFDIQYGEGNYVVIPIGRSLSSIGKGLALKIGAENVKNIPMSSMRYYYTSGKDLDSYARQNDTFTLSKSFNDYKKYLDSIGLSKEEINKSGKNYILMDYNCTGKSLKAAYTLLTSDKLWGNDKNNISYTYISDISSTFKNSSYYGDFDNSEYKDYSFVARMDFCSGYNDINTLKDYKHLRGAELVKLFGFLLMDNEFSKDNSEVEKSLQLKSHKYECEIPNQNRKIYMSPSRQYFQDVYTDYVEIQKLKLRLDEFNRKLRKSQSELLEKSNTQNRVLEQQLTQKIEEKFPLEYEYFKNHKRAKELSNSIINKFREKIFADVPGLEENSQLYKFLERKEKYFENQANTKAKMHTNKVIAEIENANAELQKAESCMKRYSDIADEMSDLLMIKPLYVDELEVFYGDFHPKLQKTFSRINKHLPVKLVEDYINKIESLQQNAETEQIKKLNDFKKEFEENYNNIKPCRNQEKLNNIVKEQKKALNSAFDMMFPF